MKRRKEKHKSNIFQNFKIGWLFWVILGLFLLVFIGISFDLTSTCWWEMSSCMLDVKNPFKILILVITGIIACSLVINSKLVINKNTSRIIIRILLTLVFIVGIFLIAAFNGHVSYTADSMTMINSIKSGYATTYLDTYPYQRGATFVIYIGWKILGEGNFMLFYFLNLGAILLIVYMIYKITIKMTKSNYKIACFAAILCAIFVPIYYYLSSLYGDIIGISLSLLFIYLFISTNKNNWKKNLIIMIPVLALIVFFKQSFIVIPVFLGIATLFLGIPYKGKIVRIVGLFSCIVVAQISSMVFINWHTEKYTPEEHTSIPSTPFITQIAMGLQSGLLERDDETKSCVEAYRESISVATSSHHFTKEEQAPGQYNNFNGIQVACNNSDIVEISKEAIMSSVKSLLSDPEYFFRFFKYKYAYEWANPAFASHIGDGGSLWTGNYMIEDDTPYWIKIVYGNDQNTEWIAKYEKYYQMLIYIGGILGVIFSFAYIVKRKIQTFDYDVFIVIISTILMGIALYTIWESSSRFILLYFILIIPVASYGIYHFGVSLAKTYGCARNAIQEYYEQHKNSKSPKSQE